LQNSPDEAVIEPANCLKYQHVIHVCFLPQSLAKFKANTFYLEIMLIFNSCAWTIDVHQQIFFTDPWLACVVFGCWNALQHFC